jgi:formate/nitrite transporter FocA (FNT family)
MKLHFLASLHQHAVLHPPGSRLKAFVGAQIPFGMKVGSGMKVQDYIWRSMIPVYIGNTIAGVRRAVRHACQRWGRRAGAVPY